MNCRHNLRSKLLVLAKATFPVHLGATLILAAASLITFSANAQSSCDSLSIEVQYAAFHETLLEVKVANTSTELFGYPAFIIYNSNGDTIAIETPSLFGIGAASRHALSLYPGMPQTPTFSGTLALYSNFFDTLVCSYQRSFDLCPDTTQPAVVYLGNSGGALVTGTANYEIVNTATQTVQAGTLQLTSSAQQDEDTVWLTPGSYMLQISQINLSPGGQKNYGLKTDEVSPLGLGWIYNSTADTNLPFSYYSKCVLPTSVGNQSPRKAAIISVYQKNLVIHSPDQKPLEQVMVYSIDGRTMKRQTSDDVLVQLEVSDLPPGIYIVQVSHGGTITSGKVFID